MTMSKPMDTITFSIALAQSSNFVPFVLYIKNKTDITDAVLTELNKNAPKPAEK